MSKFLDNLKLEKQKLYIRGKRIEAKIAMLEDELKQEIVLESPYRMKIIRIEYRALARINTRLSQIQKHFDNAVLRLNRAFFKDQEFRSNIELLEGKIYDLAYQSYTGMVVEYAKGDAFNIQERIFTLVQELNDMRERLRKRQEYRANIEQEQNEGVRLYNLQRKEYRKRIRNQRIPIEIKNQTQDKDSIQEQEPIKLPEVSSNVMQETFLKLLEERAIRDTKTEI